MEQQYTREMLMSLSMEELKEIALKEARKRNYRESAIDTIEHMEEERGIKYNVMAMLLHPNWTDYDFLTDILLD